MTRIITKPVIFTTAPRPEDIPADWVVFNAPRPIYGHKCWEGEYNAGTFYAAIDMSDKWGEEYLKETLLLDGYPLQFITEEFQKEWVREFYAQDKQTIEWMTAGDIRSEFYTLNSQSQEFTINA